MNCRVVRPDHITTCAQDRSCRKGDQVGAGGPARALMALPNDSRAGRAAGLDDRSALAGLPEGPRFRAHLLPGTGRSRRPAPPGWVMVISTWIGGEAVQGPILGHGLAGVAAPGGHDESAPSTGKDSTGHSPYTDAGTKRARCGGISKARRVSPGADLSLAYRGGRYGEIARSVGAEGVDRRRVELLAGAEHGARERRLVGRIREMLGLETDRVALAVEPPAVPRQRAVE